jgi:chorismate-pyruvate lyase
MRTSTSLPLRMLLHSDGTVTSLLEACFGAPVVVETIANEVDDRLPTPLELELAPHRPVLWRQVVLHVDDRPVLRASSVLALDRLDDRAIAALLAGDEPIGTVLRRFDTRRQLLAGSSGEASAADQLDLGVEPDALVHTRTYSILSAGRPLAVVTERIPASTFDGLDP